MEPSTQRADAWLRKKYPDLSRQQVREAFAGSYVRRPNGARVQKGERLAFGDLVFEKLDAHLENLRCGFLAEVPVLHEDSDLLVIDKPAGMASHPVHLEDNQTVTHWAFHRYPELRTIFTENQPILSPHRLDTDTSGLLLVAKNKQTFSKWREHFTKKEVSKTYLVWCYGIAEHENFNVAYPIGHWPKSQKKMKAFVEEADRVEPPLREAESQVTVLKQLPDRFLAEIQSTSGVTHQIRVHMAAIGHPLVGDSLYGERSEVGPHLLRAVLLSCYSFTFRASRETFMDIFSSNECDTPTPQT